MIEKLAKEFVTLNEAWMKAALIASTAKENVQALCKEQAELWLKKDIAYNKLKEAVSGQR